MTQQHDEEEERTYEEFERMLEEAGTSATEIVKKALEIYVNRKNN